jgi:hypothetical protein
VNWKERGVTYGQRNSGTAPGNSGLGFGGELPPVRKDQPRFKYAGAFSMDAKKDIPLLTGRRFLR